MFAFHYRRVSAALLKEMKDAIYGGESVALFGPRYVGKGYVMKRLRAELAMEQETPVVWVDLSRIKPIVTEEVLFNTILKAVNEAPGGADITAHLADGLFSPLDHLTARLDKPAIVFFPYVDGIAHNLARSLLQAVRTRVSVGEFVVVLSGEMDLRNLVHGPNSEFNCAHQYVLQGYELDEFTVYLRRYALSLNLHFRDEAGVAHRLREITGGNVHMLRILLGSVIEQRVRSGDPQIPTLEITDIPQSLDEIQPPGMRRSEVFRYTMRLINYEPECWRDLANLIAGQPVAVAGLAEDAPSHLELAGAAIRAGTQLRFASPLMEGFLRQQYDHRRFGDLYARIRQWDEAFRHYDYLSNEERLRPYSTDDRGDAMLTVKVLGAALYSKAAEGIEAVKKFFALGCRYVLGFSEVTFWQRNGAWKPQPLDGFPSNTDANEVAQILPQGIVSPGPWVLPKHWSGFGLIAILPAARSDRLGAVAICNFERRIVISHERAALAQDLLDHFVKAYTHAIQFEQTQLRLGMRNKHLEVINSIFEGLGKDVLNPKQVLALAARGLRNLGYRRVLFCLVDGERKMIKGVLDDSDDKSVDVAAMTEYPLDQPLADLQPYIISTKKYKIVEDATREPLANATAVSRAKMRAEALVPIINLDDEAIGTIHIERADHAVPTKEEVEDLQTFGRQLAVAIEQSNRVSLLQSALDKIPEPLIIVDSGENIRYVNQPGAALLHTQSGWRDHAETGAAQQELAAEIQEMIRESLGKQQRAVHHIQQFLDRLDYRGEVLTDSLPDWQGKTIGGLLHIRDMSYLYQVLQAFRLVLEASDAKAAINAMLEAAKLLKYKWGRLYLIDERDPERLISKLSFGFKDKERERLFNAGLVELPRRSTPGIETWLSIEDNTPVVFYYTKQLPHRSRYKTPHGLEAIVINHTQQAEELEKEENHFWMDIPLGTREHWLGKMTINCAQDLRPEDFELMKLLLEVASGNLAAHLRRDRETFAQMHSIKVATAEKIMASVAHNLATRLASLPVLLARYRARESGAPDLKTLNDNFQHILQDTLTTIRRAKERLATVALKTAPVDLTNQLRRTLRSALPDQCIAVESNLHPIEAQVDTHLLEIALLELIQNSREMVPDPERLRVKVRLEDQQLKTGRWVSIIYEDNGPGVPTDLKQRIFEDFFSRRLGQKTGTGLGLGFVRRVVEAHGGHIIERGEPGQGAQFVIALPQSTTAVPLKENGYVSHPDR